MLVRFPLWPFIIHPLSITLSFFLVYLTQAVSQDKNEDQPAFLNTNKMKRPKSKKVCDFCHRPFFDLILCLCVIRIDNNLFQFRNKRLFRICCCTLVFVSKFSHTIHCCIKHFLRNALCF